MLPRFEQKLSLDAWPDLRLPICLLTRYVFFLARRPISKSNTHYLEQRLKGLKLLAELLRGTAVAPLNEALRLLETMTPANFHRFSEQFQFLLLPLAYAADEIPSEVVVANQPPPLNFFQEPRRILLATGPAIGIGDEAILFPLPLLLKNNNPTVELTVLSTYRGLWDRVNGVDHVLYYNDYVSLLQAVRGQAPFTAYDMIILADFERPSLYASISHDAKIARYVELSLGTQSLFLVDNQQRWLYRAPRLSPYFTNYYAGFNQLTAWAGLSPLKVNRFSTVVQSKRAVETTCLQVYVNPFTSKYDPSEAYWSRLLSAIFAHLPERSIQFTLEPGPNAETRRFATALMRSLGARVPPSTMVVLSESKETGSRQLQDVFSEMARAQIALCSDSFAAHMAPLFGCTTLILAQAGLENWRVPYKTSFYFSAEAPLDTVILGIQQVVKEVEQKQAQQSPARSMVDVEHALHVATQKLQKVIELDESDGNFKTICETYHDFNQVYQAGVERLAQWPPEFKALLADFTYARPLPTWQQVDALPENLQQDLVLYIQDALQQWQNTNLRKYIGMIAE